jgi:hypothetical protein
MPKSHPGVFSDLGKRVNDLLTKEFPSEKQENKISWKGQPNKETTLETNFVQRKDGSILGVFIPKYFHRDWGTTFTSEINTRKEVKLEASAENIFNVDGLKTTVTGYSKGSEAYGEFGVEYKHELAVVNASVDYGKATGSTVKASAVLGANGIALGARTEYFIGGESEMKELTTVLSYSQGDFDFAVFGRILNQNDIDRNEVGVSYFHKVNSDWLVGAEAVFDTANSEAKPTLAFGTQYQIHPDTILKSKFDTTGKLGISVQQKYNRNSRFTFSGTIDTNNLGGKNSSSLGVSLSLND